MEETFVTESPKFDEGTRQKTISLNITQRQQLDAPMIIEKINSWLKISRNQNILKSLETRKIPFEFVLFYPEYAKRDLGMKPQFGEVMVRVEGIGSDDGSGGKTNSQPPRKHPHAEEFTKLYNEEGLIPVEIYKFHGYVLAFIDSGLEKAESVQPFSYAPNKDVPLTKITRLLYHDIQAPTLQKWVDSYHVVPRCEGFLKIPVLDLARMVITELSGECKDPHPQSLLCDMLWSFCKRLKELDEQPFLPDLQIFIESSFTMMFAEFEMFEELHEWLPGDVYDAVRAKLESCKEVFRQALRRGQTIRNNDLSILLKFIAKESYGNGQFEAIDEPVLFGARIDGSSEGRFEKFWREL